MPTRNQVDELKKKLLPAEIKSEDHLVTCNVRVVMKQTVESLLETNSICSSNQTFHVTAKFGLDGSGNHNYRHQIEGGENGAICSNYIASFWCPLRIEDRSGSVVWSNPTPNSTVYARPITLVKAKETRDNIKLYFKDTLSDLKVAEVAPFELSSGAKVFINTQISMVDGKMVDILQGDSGAFCHYCKFNRSDANNLEYINQGFTIEKNYESILTTWRQLESGEIAYNDPARAGQCHEPMVEGTLRFFAILHQKLRSLDWSLKILYHLVSNQTSTWSVSNHRVKSALEAARDKVIKEIRASSGLLLDTVTDSGGNTNTGPVADRFFGPKDRKNICSVIKNADHREYYEMFLHKMNIFIAVSQQVGQIVDPIKVKELGYEIMCFVKDAFPFVMFVPSVHQMLAHNWELFELTGGRSISEYSEQASESWNKYIRSYKSGVGCKARQLSIKLNMLDIFTRIFIRTHPFIADKKRFVSCGTCSKTGHTSRSCVLNSLMVDGEEEAAIKSFYV